MQIHQRVETYLNRWGWQFSRCSLLTKTVFCKINSSKWLVHNKKQGNEFASSKYLSEKYDLYLNIRQVYIYYFLLCNTSLDSQLNAQWLNWFSNNSGSAECHPVVIQKERHLFPNSLHRGKSDKQQGSQGAKKVIFTACHSGKFKLAFTSPNITSTSPWNFLMSRIDFTVLL